jgi:hypothetical protein
MLTLWSWLVIFSMHMCPSRVVPGPISDQLLRKAYVAAYDRRMRHPAWVSFERTLIPPPNR